MTQSLSARLNQPGLISAPGVFDMISARIADGMGFDALYMTGYGVVASHLGLPDAGLASYTEMVGRVRQIAAGTSTPLIADGDTGYGGLLNVDFTVRGYEEAGAQAIQIEDQEFPKKCGHTPGRRVVPIADAARRIKVAVAGAFVEGFSDRRPHRCPHLARPRRGAAPRRSLSEGRRRPAVHRIAGKRGGDGKDRPDLRRVPLVANMVEGGRTPILRRAELEALGFKLAIFPVAGLPRRGRRAALGLWRDPVERFEQGVERRALSVRRFLAADGVRAGLGV